MSFRPYVILFAAFLGLTACASGNHYDPTAQEISGRVALKEISGAKYQDRADGSRIMILNGAPMNINLATIKVYKYRVETPLGEQVIESEYPSFEVGSCVKVFLSDKPSYPRIAPGGDCAK